jgi:hypothetical protein
MGVEPLANIRDGILVEGLVKTMRYVADMRRCQHVFERPERVIRRQGLNVEYVGRRAGDSLVLQHADQSWLFDDGPARRIVCGSRPAADAAREVVERWLLYGRAVSVGHRRLTFYFALLLLTAQILLEARCWTLPAPP